MAKPYGEFIGLPVAGCATCRRVEMSHLARKEDECSQHGLRCTEPQKQKHHVGNGKPQGIFAGTLTMGTTTPENEETMVVAIKKIMNQQTCPLRKYKWYVEYTERGLPHVHFIYETLTGGRIHAKIFKRYWKLWDESVRHGKGFQGGYHKECHSETAYDEYISKDGGRSGSANHDINDDE